MPLKGIYIHVSSLPVVADVVVVEVVVVDGPTFEIGTLERVRSYTLAQGITLISKPYHANKCCCHSLALPTRRPSKTAPGTVALMVKLVPSPAKNMRPSPTGF